MTRLSLFFRLLLLVLLVVVFEEHNQQIHGIIVCIIQRKRE
jgi:hypothetical protein